MRATALHTSLLALALATAPLAACGDSGGATADTTEAADTAEAADTSVADTAEAADTSVADTTEVADTAVADTADTFVADTAEATDTAAADTSLPSVDDNCAQASLEECFSNHDCAAAKRCQDISSSGFEIPCCVSAPRGTAAVGATCVDAEDCASGLCVSRNDGPYLCTDTCDDVNDCPANMQQCDTFFVAPGTWCLHTP